MLGLGLGIVEGKGKRRMLEDEILIKRSNEEEFGELEGLEEDFTRAYMSLPYEMDANAFAYEKVKEICGDTATIRELINFWIPKEKMDYEELRKLFLRIEKEIKIR